jgi:biopolymer transport protein ExbD
MNRARTAALAERSGPDLTSMIDVVFLLLVFFLCTLQFRALDGQLPTHLSRNAGAAAHDATSLTLPLELLVARDAGGPRVAFGPFAPAATGGSGWIGVGGIEARVAGALATDPDLRVLIQADDGVLHDDVVRVVDACLSAGADRIGFGGSR